MQAQTSRGRTAIYALTALLLSGTALVSPAAAQQKPTAKPAAAAPAKTVVAQLRDFGRARRGWLGVRIQQVSPDIAESVGMKEAAGAMVAGTPPSAGSTPRL